MATSFSYQFQNISSDRIIRDAFSLCGLNSSLISGWQYNTARTYLDFIFSSWISKRGLNLFSVEQNIIEIVPGKKVYPLPMGTSKILECILSKANRIIVSGSLYTASDGGNASTVFTSTPTIPCLAGVNGWVQCIFPTPQSIEYVGILIDDTTQNSQTLQLEIQCSFANSAFQNQDWITILSIPSQTYYSKQTQWFSLPFTENALTWRILETGGNPLSLSQIFLDIPYHSLPMDRVGRDEYTFYPLTQQKGVSSTYYVARTQNPTLHVWLIPDNTWAFIVYNRVRQIQDIGDFVNSVDISPRFLYAASAELASRLAMAFFPDKSQALIIQAEQLFLQAAREDTENVNMQLTVSNQGLRS